MHWWRQFWQLVQAPLRRHTGSRLVVLPVVLAGVGIYAVSVVMFLTVTGHMPMPEAEPAWGMAVFKILIALGAPVTLGYFWHRSRPVRRVLRVVDWFGAGIISYSVVWMGEALDEFINPDHMGLWGQVLLPYSWVLWGIIGTGLFIVGTVDLSRELSTEWRERQRLESLMEFTQQITSLDYDSIVTEAVDHLYQLLEADACILFLWNEEEQVLVPVAGKHDPAVYTREYIHRMMTFKCPLGFGITGWVMETGQPAIVGDVMADSHSQAVPGWSSAEKSSLLAPIQVEGRRLGVVRLTRQGLHQFERADLDLTLSFAGQAALVFEHARIVKELSELSITDSMTGLGNSRHFHNVIAVEINRAERSHQPLALVMIDSDSLKMLNDLKGHQRGDEHIRMIGRVLRENIRLSDYAFRYAGDEFLLLLPNTGPDEAATAAERIRALIEDCEVDAGLSVTVSMGIAVYPANGTDAESLLSAADRAMYESKRSGKNRVTTAYVGTDATLREVD